MGRGQILGLGATVGQVDGWVARGKLHAVHPGVYLAGPIAGPHTCEMAAVLACGPQAAISHRSGVHLYELLPYPARRSEIHVTVPGSHARRLKGVRVHRAALASHEIRERHGIPVTAPIRTLADFAGSSTDAELERAVAEAFALRLTTRDALLRGIPPGRRGARRLRMLLDAGAKRTRSTPERVLLNALRAAGLEEPLTNHRIGRWEVDFHWPDHGLVVEVDAYSTHSSPSAFERDRCKTAELEDLGLRVRRVTARQIREDLDAVMSRIVRLVGG